jgi:hypothetical protein
VFGKTTVIVLVIRARADDNCHLLLKKKGETMKDESRKRVARLRLPVF